MTKDEFRAQFKRLVIAGYRLPGDVPEVDVMAEWFLTFETVRAEELAAAISALNKTKPDTFWPSIGEVYQLVLADRKERWREEQVRHSQYLIARQPTEEQREASRQFWHDMKAKFGFTHPSVKGE